MSNRAENSGKGTRSRRQANKCRKSDRCSEKGLKAGYQAIGAARVGGAVEQILFVEMMVWPLGLPMTQLGLPFYASLGIRAWLKRGRLEKPISGTKRKKIDRLFIGIIPFIPYLSWGSLLFPYS
jgi:hypothetical protein